MGKTRRYVTVDPTMHDSQSVVDIDAVGISIVEFIERDRCCCGEIYEAHKQVGEFEPCFEIDCDCPDYRPQGPTGELDQG